ncbi:hypothetical protein DITRI_Ditri12bG0127900 [Diplodiscus trichospermus]
MYGELKLTLLIYLWCPKTKGTGHVYETLLRPFMVRHETAVDRKIEELKARAWDFALYYWQNCTALGQTKFFEILQYLARQSSSLRNGDQKSDQQNPEIPPPPPNGFRSESVKSKNRSSTTINSSVVESPKSKQVQLQTDSQSVSEHDRSDDTSKPESPSNSKLQQARLKLRRTKPHN